MNILNEFKYTKLSKVNVHCTPVKHGRFRYPEKMDLSSVHVYSTVHLTSHYLQGTRINGHVKLVTLYLRSLRIVYQFG